MSSEHVKMYLDKQKTNSLHQAAVLADDYFLTHKATFPSKSEQSGTASDHRNSEAGRQSPPISRSRNHNQGRGHFDNFRELAGGSVCYCCKKRGHVMAECQALEKKNVKKSNALVIPQDPGTPAVQPASSRDQYNPFISKGFVSLSECAEKIRHGLNPLSLC